MNTLNPYFVKHHHTLMQLDAIILYLLTLDVFVRFWRAPTQEYGWNAFELIIILASLMAHLGEWEALRGLRFLLLLRIAGFFPTLDLLMRSFVRSFGELCTTFLVLVIISLVYGYAGYCIWGPTNHYFASFDRAMITMAQIIAFDDMGNVMSALISPTPLLGWCYIISFILCTVYTFVNILVGVMVKAVDKEVRDEEAATQKDIQKLSQQIESLKKLVVKKG